MSWLVGEVFIISKVFINLMETLKSDLTCFWEMGGCQKQSVAGAARPWGHICVLCSLSGNILIWSLCFYKTGQDLFYPPGYLCQCWSRICWGEARLDCFQREPSKLLLGPEFLWNKALRLISSVSCHLGVIFTGR